MSLKKAFRRSLTDAALTTTIALPAAAGTVVTPPIDTEARSTRAAFVQEIEARASIPALAVGVLPNTETLTVSIEASDDVTFGTGVETLRQRVFTGAGGVGVKAGTVQVSIDTDARRYYRAKAIGSTHIGDGSALKLTFQFVR